MFIAKNLQRYRRECNLTQKQLAELSGISISTITKLESEVFKTPSAGIVATLAIVLYVNISDLEAPDITPLNPFKVIDKSIIEHLNSKGFDESSWSPHNSGLLFSKEDWQIDIIVNKALGLNDVGRYEVIEYTNTLLQDNKYKK